MPIPYAPSGSIGSAPVQTSSAGTGPIVVGSMITLLALAGLAWLLSKLWARQASPAEHWIGVMVLALAIVWVSQGPTLPTVSLAASWMINGAQNIVRGQQGGGKG